MYCINLQRLALQSKSELKDKNNYVIKLIIALHGHKCMHGVVYRSLSLSLSHTHPFIQAKRILPSIPVPSSGNEGQEMATY